MAEEHDALLPNHRPPHLARMVIRVEHEPVWTRRSEGMMSPIDPIYFDRQIFALYRAIWERWGDEAWYVVWRSGEVLYDEIEPELGLQPEDDPFTAMQRLADYLQRVGYVEQITVQPVSADEWWYEMLDPVILPGAERLLAVGAVPAHISTTLMFALLRKRFGLQAEMIGTPDLRPDGRAIERWRLVPMTVV